MKYSVWQNALNAFKNKDYKTALKIYSTINHHPQILFNMATIHMLMNNYDDAISCLTSAITIDKKFVIAYYQRGICYFTHKKDFQSALEDFGSIRDLIKSRKVIDYSPAGLNHKLYMCEIIYNSASCYFALGNKMKADVMLNLARKMAENESHILMIKESQKMGNAASDIFSISPDAQFISNINTKSISKRHSVKSDKKSRLTERFNSVNDSGPFIAKRFLKEIKSNSLLLNHLSEAKSFLDYTPNDATMKKTNSILKVQSADGNLIIALEDDMRLEYLKEKVSIKLRNLGTVHYDELSFTKNGSLINSDKDLKDLLSNQASLELKLEKDIVDLYLDL